MRLQCEHLLRFLAPLPDSIGDNEAPHKGHFLASSICFMERLAVLGLTEVTTILDVGNGRNTGAGICLGFGMTFLTLSLTVLIDEPPPHAPHPIMSEPS
jgi:hypothetical protein